MKKKNIAIFASGEGTNAQKIIDYFKSSNTIKVALIVSNKSAANVLNRAKSANIPILILNKEDFYKTNNAVQQLVPYNVDFIVLAGFLWMVPDSLIKVFPYKIINIHPALLPKFGGKGMYGLNVHKAVLEAKEKESGITIHYVNENYDDGEIIAQIPININANETAESLSNKIHNLEYQIYPQAIELVINAHFKS